MDLSLPIFTLFSSPFCMKCIGFTTRTYICEKFAIGSLIRSAKTGVNSSYFLRNLDGEAAAEAEEGAESGIAVGAGEADADPRRETETATELQEELETVVEAETETELEMEPKNGGDAVTTTELMRQKWRTKQSRSKGASS
jgi:hypothetical protein